MKRLLLAALLVTGCMGTPATSPPSPAPATTPSVAAPTEAPTAAPTASTAARPMSVEPELCELLIDAGDGFESLLLDAGSAIGDPEAMDRVVDTADELARALNDDITLGPEPRHLAVQTFADALQALDDARLAHLTGDDAAYITALGDLALAGQAFRQVCA